MLEVGLVGAPGSGKSTIATAVGNKLMLDVLTHPADKLAMLDIAVGTVADYIINMEIAMLRHFSIREQRRAERPFISKGTLIESLAYAGMSVEDTQVDVPTSVMRNQMLREMHVATLIGCMMLDLQTIENLFYLPLLGEADIVQRRIDQAIRDVIDTYKVPVTVVDGDNQAEIIITHLLESEKNAES